jgi:hypothetical protein
MKANCDRCRRIQAAIDDGVPAHEAREVNGWDECAADNCPMLPKPYVFKTIVKLLREPARETRPTSR